MRISVTTIESYRLYLLDVVSEADLLASIRGEFTPTREVNLGRALHSILEKPEDHESSLYPGTYACDGITFPGAVVRECLTHVDPAGMFEVKATKEYRVGGRAVTVVAKVDQLCGLTIREHKTRWDTYEPDRYATSCQWRFYLDVFEALAVTYVVFLLSEYKDGEIGLRGIETLPLYPYPALHAECEDLVRGFVEYVTARGLESYLQPRVAA